MILVVGATGTLGGRITKNLLEAEHSVRVLVRPGSDYGGLVEIGAQPVAGDLKDPESLARACTGITTVIATANSAGRRAPDTVESVDRHGNRALIDAARSAGVDHFIFVSGLGAADDSPVEFLRAKGETEAYLRESGMTWTVLRPNIFMETWIGVLIAMPIGQGRPVTLVGRGDHRHAMISQRDVAAFAVAAVTNPAARNMLLVLGGPDAPTWTEVAEAASLLLGRDVPVQYVAPGQPLPGLPDVVNGLATSFEMYETVFDTTPTAVEYGVRLTPLTECLKTLLVPIDA